MAKRITTISPKARKLIRMLRNKLGRAIWNLNESDLVDKLRDKYRGDKPWTDREIEQIAKEVAHVKRVATDVGVKLQRMLKDRRLKIQKQSRARVQSAINGIEIGASALGKVSPGKLGQVIEVTFGEEADDPTAYRYLTPIVYFGMCRDETTGASMDEGCYVYGMRALRLAVLSLYYTLLAKDGRNVVLNEIDSAAWREALEKDSVPPGLYTQFADIANDEGVTVYVYDNDKNLVGVIPPVATLAGADQRALQVQASLKQSKRARQRWGYRWSQSTPSNSMELKEVLSPSQGRRVAEFLARHPERSFSIEEIAALADVKVGELEDVPVAEVSEEYTANRPSVDDEPDSIADAMRDIGMMEALWKMDL